MRNSTLLYGRVLLWIAFGSNFWSSEDRVRARFHYAESRQNKPQVNLGGNLLLDVASQEINHRI